MNKESIYICTNRRNGNEVERNSCKNERSHCQIYTLVSSTGTIYSPFCVDPWRQYTPLGRLVFGARSQCVSVANIGFVSSWVECTVYEDVLCVYFVYIYVYVTAFSWFTVGLVVLCLYMPLNINPNDCQQHWNSHSLAVVADVDCTGCNTVPK